MKEIEKFEMEHDEGKLFVLVTINGESYRKEVTQYFNEDNPFDDWLDYRLGLIY